MSKRYLVQLGQAYMMLAVSIELLIINSRFHALPSKILNSTPSNPC